MILFKQWAIKKQDMSCTYGLGSLLKHLEALSGRVLATHNGELQPETQAAFNLSSIICKTRRWEWPWAIRKALDHMYESGASDDINVLDIGSGFRPFTIWLRDFLLNVTAVDNLSWNTKENLAGLFEEYGINFVNADATDLPFADGEFDYSFCISVIEHCEEDAIKKIISEGCRVTKPRGLFIVTVDACDKVDFLLPDDPIPEDVIRTNSGAPVAGIIFTGENGGDFA